MKTTIDINDSLFAEVKDLALRENVTIRELVETGLRMALEQRRERKPFKLRDGSFRGPGAGLRPEFVGNWDRLRDAMYEGRGA
ncbi:MAG: hypothetical protein V7637_4213 [Mycobacteriales bacterium]|jgi:hypothetical protein